MESDMVSRPAILFIIIANRGVMDGMGN